mgnify:CR=1 FL=1
MVPGVRLELTRFWHRPLKTAWLPLHHPGKYYMAPKRELDLVNRMLAGIPQEYVEPHLQMLYERGYMIGLLAQLAYEDNAVRDAIVAKIKELEGL